MLRNVTPDNTLTLAALKIRNLKQKLTITNKLTKPKLKRYIENEIEIKNKIKIHNKVEVFDIFQSVLSATQTLNRPT